MAAGGISAGGAMALWLAFRSDMAEPESHDPVTPESTRPSCACVFDCQTSHDPRFIAELVGGRAHSDGALPLLFGLPKETWPALVEATARLVQEAAPVNFLGADAPPLLCIYSGSARPVTDEDPPLLGIHHPSFGFDLQRRMPALGCECTVLADQSGDQAEAILRAINEEVLAFLKENL